MKNLALLFILFSFSLINSTRAETSSCKRLIATGNPDYPPYLWRNPNNDNELIGANADLMKLLAKEIGVTIDVNYIGTWGRVQEEAKTGHVDLIAGAFFTKAREDYMDYFNPAFRETRSLIFVKEKAVFPYKQWSDLKNKSGLTVVDNSFGEKFDKYAKENLNILTVASLEQALRMLALGRADYLVYEDSPGLAYIAKLDLKGLKILTPPISNENLYLTLSHRSSCNSKELKDKIAKAIVKLTKQKVMDRLIEKNIQLWKKQTKHSNRSGDKTI